MKKHIVTNVRPLENFVVEVQFDHEIVKKFDVKPYIFGNWFGELANQEIFRTVRPAGNTIQWCNGQDIAPHELWENSFE